MPLHIVRNDITKMQVDAIVNAANSTLLGGGGVDGCIHRAAGVGLLRECMGLGGCKTGSAKVTAGYRLPCKYVIHAVGPRYRDGKHGERDKLVSCYRTALGLAKEKNCESVAFPLISSGIYGYPKDEALKVAVDTIGSFLMENDMTVYLVIFDKKSYQIGNELFSDIQTYIDDRYVEAHSEPEGRRLPPDSVLESTVPEFLTAKPKAAASVPPKTLEEAVSQMDESFSQMLLRKIDEAGMTDSQCYKKSGIMKQSTKKCDKMEEEAETMRKQLRKMLGLLCMIGLLAAAVTGCKGEDSGESVEQSGGSADEALSEGEDSRSAESEEAEELDPETAELIKYNIYIEMNNYLVELLNNIDYYYLVVADQEEFSLLPDTGYSYGFNIHYLNTDIIDDALAAADLEPAFDLDAMTKEIAEPMRTMMEAFNTISDAGGSYADNQYELPKTIHPTIQENWLDFYEMALNYINAVDEMASASVQEEEAKMQEEGRLIIYNASHCITVVNEILSICTEQGVDDTNLTELDLTEIKPLYEELVETVAAYDAACSDNDQLMLESLPNSAPFDGLLDSLAQSVEWMIGQVESQTPIDDPSLSPLGSIGHIHDVLSSCIDRYNSVFVE